MTRGLDSKLAVFALAELSQVRFSSQNDCLLEPYS